MRTDQQLEQLLRATFAARSGTVTGGPAWAGDAATEPDTQGPAELLDLAPRRPSYRFAPLAAAAVVALAVAGLVVGVRAASEHPTRPAAPNTASPTTGPTPDTAAPVCPGDALGSAWQDATTQATVFDAKVYGQVNILGTAADGTVVAESTTPGLTGETMVLAFGAASLGQGTIQPIATITGKGDGAFSFYQLQGNTLLVGARFSSGPGTTPATPSVITLIDIQTGQKTVLMQQRGANSPGTDSAFLQDGVAYWDEFPAGTNREIVYAYDVATATRTVAYEGLRTGAGLEHSAAGTWWTGSALHPDRPAALPAPIVAHVTTEAARQSLVTDGTSYAWRTDKALGWWSPSNGFVWAQMPNRGVEAVAGPVVAFYPRSTAEGPHLFDVQTGEELTLPAFTGIHGAGGVLIADHRPTKITATNDKSTVSRLDTATLPRGRRC